jgi:hypothetical protein
MPSSLKAPELRYGVNVNEPISTPDGELLTNPVLMVRDRSLVDRPDESAAVERRIDRLGK